MNNYKPNKYNSLSPYLKADNAIQLVDFIKEVFYAREMRRFDREDGTIAHLELLVDDTILMISDSTADFKANRTMLHLYVPDVFETYELALKAGCTPIEPPVNKENDPDTRGSFYDHAGNYWAVSTQTNES